MNSMAKTIAFWVVLLITVVLLYNVFSRRSTGIETEMTFSNFLDELDHKNVKSVRILDSDLTGQLISGENFKTVVPTDYPALYDKLQGVNVQIEHVTRNPWLAALTSQVSHNQPEAVRKKGASFSSRNNVLVSWHQPQRTT